MWPAVWQQRKDSLVDSINALRFGTALRHLGGFTRLFEIAFWKDRPLGLVDEEAQPPVPHGAHLAFVAH